MNRHHSTVCQICACSCGLLATLNNGQVTRVTGDANTPHNKGRLCIKGKLSPRILYAPDRLKTPLIRRKEGIGFDSAGWEDALDKIAEKLQKIKASDGPESLAVYVGRSCRFIDRSFINAFARLFGTPNVTGVWSLCVGPKIVGYQAVFGAKLFARSDFSNAKLILLWGTNPAVSKMHRYFELPNDIRAAMKKGAELVVIDPRRHRFAREANLHLPITPGTDTLLVFALIKILIDRKWIDEAYLQSHTFGYERLCQVIEGIDLKTVCEKTGIGLEAITGLAEKLGTVKPASIDRREGVIHQSNGTQLNHALAILTAITGNADISGGLRFTPYDRWNTDLGIKNKVEVPSIWGERYPLSLDGAQTIPEAILEKKPYPIKALITIGGNPIAALPDTRRTQAALRSLDLLVVNDLFMTETARLADVVLPGVTFYEKGEFHNEPLKPVPWMQTTEPLVQPIAEARPEWRFMAKLADRMGWKSLSGFSGEDEILNRVFRDSGRNDLDPVALRHGIPQEPLPSGSFLKNGFNTPSGKIELYSSRFDQMGYPPLPEYKDVCVGNDRYPYRLVTGSRVGPFNHSQHRNIPEFLMRCPGPVAEISPKIAVAAGLTDGDSARIETEWGGLQIQSKIVEGMNPVTISIPHGWDGKRNANYLTGETDRDAVCGTPAYKAIPCRIQKAALREPDSAN
ncbi:MAG: molybdopterin-dependent oxidoreductase [Thermodesulfobacteriota bacterium]